MSKSYDLLCMGRSSLDLFSQNIGAPFAEVAGFAAFVGGCPNNICVSARRLGLRTAMLTGVGDDYVAGFIRRFLEQEDIDTRYVLTKPGSHTNAVMVALQPPDEMQFVAYHIQNADLEITLEDVAAAPLADSRMLLFTGMGLLKEPSRSATQYAAELAQQAGTQVAMDLDYRPPMWSDARIYGVTTRLTLPLVDIAIGTEDEVCAAAGSDHLPSAIEILRDCVRQVLVVKRGAQGATVYPKTDRAIDIPAYSVEVLNFLGAGDAFAGGLLYGYLQGWDWARAAQLAAACGAYIVTKHGCANDMPSLAEALNFMATYAESP